MSAARRGTDWIAAGFQRVVDARAFDALAPRHFAIWVTSRGPTIVPRSDGRAGCQQQYGQIRFAQIDVGLHDKDHIQLDAHGRMPRPVLRCGMRQKRFWIATTKNACPMPQKCSRRQTGRRVKIGRTTASRRIRRPRSGREQDYAIDFTCLRSRTICSEVVRFPNRDRRLNICLSSLLHKYA